MGKGSDTVERLRAHVLTATERRAREDRARATGPLRATADGQIVEDKPEQPKPTVVTQAPETTWD